nr:hypothetical protein [uncultured Lachnoclostridium sp.]
MFGKIVVSSKSRKKLADPYNDLKYEDRLKKSKSIDFRENMYEIDLCNGYVKRRPINKEKVFK